MNIIRIAFLMFFTFLLANFALGYNIPGDITFIGAEKLAQEAKKNVFAVQIAGDLENDKKEDDYIVLGSGFLILKNNLVVGITCRHMILDYVKTECEKIKTENGEILLKQPVFMGLDTDKGFRRFKIKVAYIDEAYDFAILLPQTDTPEEHVVLNNLVLKDIYLGDRDLIIEGKGILIIGYPLGLGTEYDKNFPVIKSGIIAQYSKQDYFLIDGIINPGNSGSPVFSLKDTKIIGMVTSFRNTQMPLYDKNMNLVATLPYNSGLTNTLSVEIIKKTLDKLFPSEQSNNSIRK